MFPPAQKTIRNRLLAALPEDEFAVVAANLLPVHLHLGQALHQAGEPIEQVYFPEIGFISAEGVAGVSVILGATASYSETMCQTGGDAHLMSVGSFHQVVNAAPHMRALLLKYVHAFNVQVSQTAACNSHHELGQRLARWLLGAHDRSGVAQLSLTQDLIAVMLGVRRSTVSVAAGMLQRAGVIRYHHGRITILDRVGLENAACECYEAVASEYRRLFGAYPFAKQTDILAPVPL